ncbi:CCR4-NOT transcription complex subunit 10-like [Liolophura sinensis]|uniref:CCR4-NOT transcription complex subunit 10-like n=1 Tax=Liolophura sinensis TaxID=3198878 RepID=UPI003158374F
MMADLQKQDDQTEKQELPAPSLPPVTEHQREVANQAMQEFDKAQYEQCSQTINKLLSQRSNDPKVVHNKAVTEFYSSKFCKTAEFRQALSKVCQLSHIPSENAESVEDVDHGIIYYNQAVLLYRLHQYRASLTIVDKLFQFIEPLEESLAKKVMFLLVELYLCTNQPEKGIGMLAYMEKALFNGGKSGAAAGGSLLEKEGSKDSKENSRDKGDSPEDVDINDATKIRISQYKARCYLMVKSLKSCKREIKSLVNAVSSSTSFGYLRSNFEYIRGNFRKANKILGSTPQTQELTASGESLPVMYFNNLGCTHFHMRKHHLGAFYFRKAINSNENVIKESTKSESGKAASGQLTLLQCTSRHHELMYNIGIELLHCGKPEAAFDCLIEAVQRFQTNPRLWLRLAECCIMEYRANNEEDRSLAKRLEPVKGSVGSGIHRKLILGAGVENYVPRTQSAAIPMATLEFAALCLRNALALLPDDPATVVPVSPDEQTEGSKTPEVVLVPAPPANPMRPPEVANLRCSILCAASYVSLCLHDFILAINLAENLLKQPRLSGAQKYLGNMYIAEALVYVDRIADAIQHLNVENVMDISTVPPEHKSEQEKLEKEKGSDKGEKEVSENGEFKGFFYPWTPRDLSKAKAMMQYNLATAHAIRGEYGKSMAHLGESAKVVGTPLPAQMYFLRLYLDLIEGRRKMAQVIIKDYFGHTTPNRVELKVSKSAPGEPPSQWQAPAKGPASQ